MHSLQQKNQDGLFKQALFRPAHMHHNRTSTAPQYRLRMNTPTLSSEPAPTSQHRESSPDAPEERPSSPQTDMGRDVEVRTSESVNDKDVSHQGNAQPDEKVMFNTEVSVQVVKKDVLPLAVLGSAWTTSSQGKESQSRLTVRTETEQSGTQSNIATEQVSVETTDEQDKEVGSDATAGKTTTVSSLDNRQATKTTLNHFYQHKRYVCADISHAAMA